MTRHRWQVVCGGLVVLAVLMVLFTRLAPWWNAGVTPVELVLHAPAESEIWLQWSEDEPPLRMVPVGEVIGGWSWFWGTELPPRPDYALAVEIREAAEPVAFAELKVWRLSPQKALLHQVSATDKAEWTATSLGVIESQADRVMLDPSNGGVLHFAQEIDRRPDNYLATFAVPIANLILLVVLGVGLIGSGLFFPGLLETRAPGVARWQAFGAVGLFLVAAGVHWHLATSSLPDYWPSDSTSYVDKGLALAYGGTFDTGGHEYELNRTPGYPLLIAAAFRLAGTSLNAIVQVQTALALFSFAFLFRELRRFLPAWALLLAIPLVLCSPPLVWASRQIATESVFVSCWVFATACFLRTWRTPYGRRRWFAWAAYAAVVTAATLVRMNGILLLVLPGCALIGNLVRAYRAHPGWWQMRLPSMSRIGFLLIPFAVVLLVLVVWSVRNAMSRGYARPTDLAPIVAANAPFNAGMLDVRAFTDEDEYAWVLRKRRESDYFFPGWSLRNHRFRIVTNEWQEIDNTSIGKLAESLRSFVAANNALIPWEARLVAWWRVLGWGFWVPEFGPFTQDGVSTDYRVPAHFAGAWKRDVVHQRLDWLARERNADGLSYPLVSVEEGRPSGLKTFYSAIVPAYPVLYRLLVLAAIGALVFAVYQRRFVVVVLLAPFFVNLLLNVYFLYIVGRYIQVLDGMLVLGLLALCSPAARDAPAAVTGSASSSLPEEKEPAHF